MIRRKRAVRWANSSPRILRFKETVPKARNGGGGRILAYRHAERPTHIDFGSVKQSSVVKVLGQLGRGVLHFRLLSPTLA